MNVIEIQALENGAHRNQNGGLNECPEGWAVIPDGMIIPDTFPFVDIEAKDGVVTSMTAGVIPDPDPELNPTLTLEERIAQLESENATLNEELTSTQLALCDVYEQLIMVTDLSSNDETVSEEEVLP